MTFALPGIHHVTAITADAQRNIDFYCGVLGLRLVKLTVNFDDPASYHLYYGDEQGRPGTIITFFAWPGGFRGRIGPPQVTATAFSVPRGAIEYWSQRLHQHQIGTKPVIDRLGDAVLSFADPDGLELEIVATSDPAASPTPGSGVTEERAIRGFHSVTLSEEGYENTARLLTNVMNFRAEASEGNRFRYRTAAAGIGSVVDVLCTPGARGGAVGAGAVHHVAFRTPNDGEQGAWRREIAGLDFNVSPVMDRNYFHSIYFREPGGVLFEIATDNPGFTVDEPAAELGRKLMLPAQYEAYRAQLEQVLPRVKQPEWRGGKS